MWKVELWVFTKGWKLLGRYKTEQEAKARADEFLPMEVQLTSPNGSKDWFGKMFLPAE